MSLARSFMWLTLSEILFNLSGYIVHSGAGRLLSPADYGRYGLIVTLSIVVVTLLGNGIPIAMSKYVSEYWKTKPEMVSIIKRQGLILQMIVIGLITASFYAVTPFISSLLNDQTLTPLFRISVFILPAYALDTYYFYYFTGIHRFNFQSILKIVRSLLRVTLIIGFIYLWRIEGAIAGYIFVPLLVFLVALFYDLFKTSKEYPQPKDENIDFDWRKLMSYAWPVTLFMIFYEVLISLDLYFIKGILHDDYQTGIYNSALMIARIPYYLFYAMTVILLPSISQTTSANDFKKAQEILTQALRFMMIVLIPVVILIAVYAGPTINFIFGAQYLDGIASLQVLSFGIGFLSIFYVLSFALNGAGLAKLPMFIAFMGMVLNAILNYYMINSFGIVGSAIATSISSFLVMIISVYYCHKIFQKIFEWTILFKMALGGALLYVFSMIFPPHNILFILWGVILTAAYLAILYALKVIDKNDLDLIKAMVSRKKRTE